MSSEARLSVGDEVKIDSRGRYNNARGRIVELDAFGYRVRIHDDDDDGRIPHFVWEEVYRVDIVELVGELAKPQPSFMAQAERSLICAANRALGTEIDRGILTKLRRGLLSMLL